MRVSKIPCWIVTNKYYRKRLPEGNFITVMDKKYQFFISSTYEDLKVEREKAIFTILEMEQFPVGMELFSAADED